MWAGTLGKNHLLFERPRQNSKLAIKRYRLRISAPLLDRIDVQVEAPTVAYRDLAESATVGEQHLADAIQ